MLNYTGYVTMVGDLFHYGHVRFLKQAKSRCDHLLVGIHADNIVQTYKQKPTMSMEERIEVVRACKYVDDVLADAPLITTPELLDKLNIDIVFVSISPTPNYAINDFYHNIADKLLTLEYTATISTTNIIKRITSQNQPA